MSSRAFVFLLAVLTSASCGDRPDAAVADSSAPAPAQDSTPLTAAADSLPGILFVGTSLTAGYGLESIDQSYPSIVQQKIDSAGYRFHVINAGVSGETSAGGANKIDWLMSKPYSVLVLELGANDGLRGLDVPAMKKNLQQIIDASHKRYPDSQIILAGMEAPPNLGAPYTTAFHDAFRDLARDNHTVLIPFLLQGVGGVTSLNQDDGIHPNALGARIVAATVWTVLEPVLRKMQPARAA